MSNGVAMDDTDRTMLALAALTYRGIASASEYDIHAKLTPWLAKVDDAQLGTWDLVWGPASFRVPVSLVDDAMAYVARRRGTQHYVVALRGTNPVSVFDWFFGDFWVDHRVAWSAGAPQALLSASTSLGDRIVRNLAAEATPSKTTHLVHLSQTLEKALGGASAAVPELDLSVVDPATSLPNVQFFDRIASLLRGAGAVVQERALDALALLMDPVRRATQSWRDQFAREIFAHLEDDIEKARKQDPGRTLLEFLAGIGTGARVSVTGHSKGGALALATALWLHEEWAPNAHAQVDCFAFAGPTGGDAGFAAYYDGALGGRTRRIVNRRDVVPHAWDVQELGKVADFYPSLGLAIATLARSVEHLDYKHVGGTLVEFEGKPLGGPLVFAEVIHQHLDAYLSEAGLAGWSAKSLMLD